MCMCQNDRIYKWCPEPCILVFLGPLAIDMATSGRAGVGVGGACMVAGRVDCLAGRGSIMKNTTGGTSFVGGSARAPPFLRLALRVLLGGIVQVPAWCARRVAEQGARCLMGMCLMCLRVCVQCCVPGPPRRVCYIPAKSNAAFAAITT